MWPSSVARFIGLRHREESSLAYVLEIGDSSWPTVSLWLTQLLACPQVPAHSLISPQFQYFHPTSFLIKTTLITFQNALWLSKQALGWHWAPFDSIWLKGHESLSPSYPKAFLPSTTSQDPLCSIILLWLQLLGEQEEVITRICNRSSMTVHLGTWQPNGTDW